ncbi:hypothetical protein IHE55_13345 [Streptomyces pactum]|uniref:Uncharacterized protein n=1 Tax=Streptomyces pactum TaxID=68249 RepID=A0ABS0NKK6_9ACTN|nr:hypothetical protein [Streptomyces pactum]MBH5335728.1 hypothetical protein [Streptomyces pactum]
MTWTEEEYVSYLAAERRAYAWVMRRYGGLTATAAGVAAVEWYPYEPPDAPYRGLVFHDEAWHWAMSAIHGDLYMVDHPELAFPCAEYRALD